MCDVNISFPEHNSTTIRNILMVLGRIMRTGHCGVSHARKTTLLVFGF